MTARLPDGPGTQGVLTDRLRDARAEVERLERQAAAATCVELGEHDWRFLGGCNAGCSDDCCCSVPVHECARCKACDYGHNDEAAEVRQACADSYEREREVAEQILADRTHRAHLDALDARTTGGRDGER